MGTLPALYTAVWHPPYLGSARSLALALGMLHLSSGTAGVGKRVQGKEGVRG